MKLKNKCYVIGIFLMTLLIAMTHQNQFARFLVGFELLLFMALFLQARFLGKQVEAKLLVPEPFAGKGEEIKIVVKLLNPLKIPVPEIRVKISCEDKFANRTTFFTGTAMLDGSGEAELAFRMTSAFCGVIGFCLDEVEVRDYLGIFSNHVKQTGQMQEVSVIPENPGEIQLPGSNRQSFVSEDSDISGSKAGDDPSEIYDIREFRQGDTIHRVHWNMSAKMDDLLVRDFGEQKEEMTLVLLDLQSREEITRNEWEMFLEHVAAVSGRLMKEACPHFVVWLDEGAKEVLRMHVDKEEEYRLMLAALVSAVPYESGQIETYYKEKFGDETLKEVIRISLAGEIVRGKT
ncbi:MAG: DUF58 domain-containing protein [Bariatricus sp.]|nr:DUF58 domain-containing protein [Bariatricus sp.]